MINGFSIEGNVSDIRQILACTSENKKTEIKADVYSPKIMECVKTVSQKEQTAQ